MSALPQWLDDPWRTLSRALGENRLHHALLLAGAKGYGKRALADALAAAALCTARRDDGFACGACRSCTLVAAGSHPDLVRVGFELRDDGKLRSELTVDQMRNLCQRLSLSSQFGGLQIAIVDPADAMNASAANALLKTLEEPASNTVIVLVADDPSRLPATIRSRCQRIDLRAPGIAEGLGWLRTQGIGEADAAALLEASLGNPGRAAEWVADGTLALREECATDLAALSGGRAGASRVAERWSADRADVRLWFAAVLAREEAARLARGERGAFGLTDRGEIPKLVEWFGRANRARGLLATPLRADLVLVDLLCDWPTAGRGSGRA